MYIIWKKYQVFSPIAELFLKRLKEDHCKAMDGLVSIENTLLIITD